MNNVVLVSGVQQNDLVLYIHVCVCVCVYIYIYILFFFFSNSFPILGCYIILSRIPWATWEVLVG